MRRASAQGRWTLQPAQPRAHDRRCPSTAVRDNGQSSTRPSQVVVMPGRLSGESRSGPDPTKLDRRERPKGRERRCVSCPGGLNLSGHIQCAGGKAIPGCARGSNRSHIRRPGPGKRAAFDEATSGDGPGGPSLGGSQTPQAERRERDRGCQRQVHDLRARPITPGRRSAARKARDHGPPRDERALYPGRPGTIVQSC